MRALLSIRERVNGLDYPGPFGYGERDLSPLG